ncbi:MULTISPECIES: AMP-binding protein [unclassified Flavobacterium]|uniref:AMP-binding protein n=1 Tax=unclassified Flavobacterium TaxID=196869 RepID=UPI001291AFCD|nr:MULTISPECIES: AMP-binding protein [unclassified Flavobacterium]MQP52860.1 AMP-binding protein [Flavobacterium sp. LMO9]MQP63134.1 AMP-binding protein [Flavobacterium sp. LMO6]
MIPHYKNIHNRFKINGVHLDKEALFQFAYSSIKEGEDFENELGEFLLDWLDDKETIELTTSGTTGTPKIITINKQAMVHSAVATGNFFNLQPQNKALLCLSPRYIAGKMMIVRALIIGLELDYIIPSSNLDDLQKDKIYDFVAIVPLQAENSLNKFDQFKKIIIGGAKVSDALALKLNNVNAEIYETYGMTETITHIAAKKIGEEYFNILSHVAIDSDERNCLVISAPTISESKIITNDIVEIDNDKKFKWLGRFDNVINSGGIKLFPEQIEAKLASKISNRFFITGLPDSLLGTKIVLVVEGEQQKFDDFIFKELDKFEKPKEIVFISEFVETNTKKVNRIQTLKKIRIDL